jgi:hypothetical protein
VLALDPIARHKDALGPERAAALKRFSNALVAEMGDLDGEALRWLAAESADSWKEVRPTVGSRLAGMEKRRDLVFGERLSAVRRIGREFATKQKAEHERNGAAYTAADERDKDARRMAGACREELEELTTGIAELRATDGNPASLIEDHPEAAIHDAAHAELCRRERERELPARVAEPVGIEY